MAPAGDQHRLAAPALLLAAVASFALALPNGPIEDDTALLGPRMAAVAGWGDLPRLLREPYWGDLHDGGLYRPLTLASVGAQRLLWGERLWPSRLVSLALHGACTWLVWRLARRMLPAGASFLAALVFAVHPVHAEAVITLYGQSDLWAALLALAAAVLHLRWAAGGQPARRWLWIAGLYLAALGFKESPVLLPLALGALRGLLVRPGRAGAGRWCGRRELIVAAALLAYLPLRYDALGAWVPGERAVVGAGAGMGGRLTVMTVSLAHSLRLLVAPWNQTTYYGHLRDSLASGGYLEALLVVAAGIALGAYCRGDGGRTWARAGTVWAGVHLLPVINLVPTGMLVAERCLYLPSAGLAVLVGGLLGRLVGRTAEGASQPERAQSRSDGIPAVLTAIALAAVGITLSARVCTRWSNMTALWTHTLADHPRSPRAGAMVVLLELQRADTPPSARRAQELGEMLDRVERLNPALPELWLARAALAFAADREEAGHAHLARAESLRPGVGRVLATRPAPRPRRPGG